MPVLLSCLVDDADFTGRSKGALLPLLFKDFKIS